MGVTGPSCHTGNIKAPTYNVKTQKMELQPILHVWINHDDDLVDLTIASTIPGKKGHADQQVSEVIHTNKKHPFLTQETGFVQVADLNVGMHLVEADGNVGVITGWQVVPGAMTMYNLEVAQDHTFTVGDGQWVVHNSSDCGQNPGDYWRQSSLNNAPMQTTPGTSILTGGHVNDLGQVEPWVAHYDQYGRLIGRTDYALGDLTKGIEPTHYHVYSYNEFSNGFPDGAMPFGDHILGEFNPSDWMFGWEFFL